MGRWKRKQEYLKKKKSSDDNAEEKMDGKAFSPFDLERVKVYLKQYRDGCFRVLKSNGNARAHKPDNDKAEVKIGYHEFSALTLDVLSQPFLALPLSLTAKQRRSIHELATQLDLFHESLGPTRDTRYFVVSIYSDGFHHLPMDGDASGPPTIPFRQCRPWFCRAKVNADNMNMHMHTVESCTKLGRKQIEALIDQPSHCLRDDLDFLDYGALDGTDLSTIQQPSTSDGDNYWMMVDSQAKMKQCAQELLEGKPTELAFDLEFYNPSKYLQVTCLLQLSSNLGKDYVIDTLAESVWDHVALLHPLFADPQIVKIGHCINGDVQSLHRDFGMFVINAFDTFEAAKVLNLKQKGLANVCQHFGLLNSEEYSLLKETYQSTDWRRRPLTEPMVRYGRYDVHYLVALRQLFMRDMSKDDLWDNVTATQESQRVAQVLAATLRSIAVAEGDIDEDEFMMDDDGDLPEFNLSDDDEDEFYTPPNEDEGQPERKSKVGAKELRMQPDLMQVLSASQLRCLGLWTVKTETLSKNTQYSSLMKEAQNGEIEWTNSHATLLEDLMTWRTKIAAQEECLEGMVCSLDLLVSVAAKRPSSETALRRIKYHLPELLQELNYREEILSIVQSSLARDGLQSVVEIPCYSSSRKRESGWTKWLAVASVTTAVLVVVFVVRRRQKR
jgi:ribonuclease D